MNSPRIASLNTVTPAKPAAARLTASMIPSRSAIGGPPALPSRPLLKIVILGSSITSSWANGHATIYRGLVRELAARGHDVLFLERDREGFAAHRDLPRPPYGRTELYAGVKDLKDRFGDDVREADFVVVGSHVPEGVAIGDWVTRGASGATAFYDLDTPDTIANLVRGKTESVSASLISRYQIYLSFTGGPLLGYLEKHYRSPMARPLYCSVDPAVYFPEPRPSKWDLGYLGTHREDRQAKLERLLLEPARRWSEGRFVVAGADYPRTLRWPKNVKHLAPVPPAKHRAFYNSQRYALNLTRAKMAAAGFSPGARLFEAAACGTPIISDSWPGIETFFTPDEEILISNSSDETLIYLEEIPEADRREIGARARERVLARHTARHRARELERYALEVLQLSGV